MDSWRKFKGSVGGGGTANGQQPTVAKHTPGPESTTSLDSKEPQRSLDQPLWGLENFGNTCYCNSILQALYASEPFRAFVEAYPDIQKPYNDFGGAIATGPIVTPPSEPNGKDAADKATPTSAAAGKEKRGGLLGLGKKDKTNSSKPVSPTPAAPAQPLVQPIVLPPDPKFPEMTLFGTIQALFHHLSTSHTHYPAPAKTPVYPPGQTPPPQQQGIQTATTGNTIGAPGATSPTGQPLGPALLASLPPPSTVRGGGPYKAGQLGRGVVRPEDVLRTARRYNQMFGGQNQQDAHEFLGFLLNQLTEELEQIDHRLKEAGQDVVDIPERGQTFIHRLFHGVLVNETRCLNCETTSTREESFLDLSVDLEQHSSLTACLRQFSHSEMLCSTNKFYCETCGGLVEAERRMRIKSLPNILGLHLKRFRQDEMGRLHKVFYRVTFPLHLRVPCTTDDTEGAERLYELYAVVVHIGNGPSHGHYVTAIRSESGGWVMCDDENIEPIQEDDLANYFGDNITGAGYVLFYQAVNLDLSSLGLKRPALPRILPPAPRPVVQDRSLSATRVTTSDRTSTSTDSLSHGVPASPRAVTGSLSQPVPASAPTQPNGRAPLPRQPSGNHLSTPPQSGSLRRRESSSTSTKVGGEKSKWYSLKRRESLSSGGNAPPSSHHEVLIPEARMLQRQSTGNTLNTVSTSTSSTGAPLANVTPLGEHHSMPTAHSPNGASNNISSSMLTTTSARSGGSGSPSVSTGSEPRPIPIAVPFPGSSDVGGSSAAQAGSNRRSVSASRHDSRPDTSPTRPSAPVFTRSASTSQAGSNGNYSGGTSLGRKLSGAAGFGKLARSSSSAFKIGFGRKKVDEE